MPVRFFGVTGFVLIALGCVSQASAGWLCDFFGGVANDTRQRRCWPEPYVHIDREAAQAPFATMTENGWRRQNMLSEFHFVPATGQLTEAGKLKVRWILTTGPSQHRIVYVHTADTDEETAARLVAVRQQTRRIAPSDLPPVLSTSIPDEGWPANQVDRIDKKFIASTPIPRLPQDYGSTSGSSGNSSSTTGN